MDIDALIDYATKETIFKLRRFWTLEEKQLLTDNIGKMSAAAIAAEIGRTEDAVHIKQVRGRIPAASKRPGWLTGNECAEALGVDIHCITRMHRRGIFPTVVIPGERGILNIKKVTLYRWATRPRNWIYFKTKNMGDQHLKRLVKLAQERYPDQWLTTGQAARLLGPPYVSSDIQRKVRRGEMPGVKWGNYYVRKSDVLEQIFYKGKGGFCDANYSTPRADDFIIRMKAEGKSYQEIGRMMKWNWHKVCYRWGKIKDNI